MEEFVGGLWDKLVTRVASRQYADATVRLEDIRKSAAILFRALGGDAGLSLAAAPAVRHGSRRRWMERIAGSGERVELAWRDQKTLRLPEQIALFPERNLNRDLYLWLIALSAVSPDDDPQPWIVRNQQATITTLQRFPGFVPRYQRLVAALLPLRFAPEQLPKDEAAQESAIRKALQNPGSVQILPKAKRPFQPVPLWPHPEPPQSHAAKNDAGDGVPEHESDGRKDEAYSRRKHLAERTDMPDGKNGFLLMFRAESLFSWSEFVKVNRPQDDDEDTESAKLAAEDMDKLTVARDGKTSVAKLRFDLDLPSAGEDDTPVGEGIPLPEWDYKKRVLIPGYCRLQEMIASDAEPAELPPHLRQTARHLRNQFQALAPMRTWLRAQQDGDEIDLDQWVRQEADRITGGAVEHGLYRAQVNRQRDLACLLLADLSLSSDAYASNTARVIDVIRDSLFLFSEALSATGDRFALHGFSSLRRNHIRFYRIKDFDEHYDANTRGRIAIIKPGYYTRMGAAIRHASNLLAKQKNQQRLLLLLSDGKPNDLDHYEGRHGIEDTRVAIMEARKQGLRPFCVTIDREASDYLPHLFGTNGYAVIRHPEELPRELPLLYAQMTR
ncbi:MAG: VWA domain-containing protein [Methylobacillus sp.]|jgi:nitric oxide reductase NorD protein|nr:VWA domain-containing protein [Methylobacillus sp.]